jgi:hypothetical protein
VIQVEMTDMPVIYFSCRRSAQRLVVDVRDARWLTSGRGGQPELPGEFHVELPGTGAAA